MNKRNFFIILEYVWILMALFCLGVGIYYQIKIGPGKVWLFYGLSAVSFGMFGVRRMQRKNGEKRKRGRH